MYSPFSLENKSILITGASSGIGRAIAIECSRMGAHLHLTGRNEKRLLETLSFLDQCNHHTALTADLSSVDRIITDDQITPEVLRQFPNTNIDIAHEDISD